MIIIPGLHRPGGRRLLAAALTIWVTAVAAAPSLRARLDETDLSLINQAGGEYSQCLADQASRHFDATTDLRRIAGQAAEECRATLDKLDRQLRARGLNPDYYYGIIRTIRNRAVNQMLYGLMAARAAGQSGS